MHSYDIREIMNIDVCMLKWVCEYYEGKGDGSEGEIVKTLKYMSVIDNFKKIKFFYL